MASSVGSLFVELGADVAHLKRDLGRANRQLDKFASRTTNVMSGVASAVAAIGVADLGRQIFEAGRQAQSMERAFTALSGSSVAAAQEMAFLRTVADDLGQNFYTLADSYKSITAASAGTSMQGRQTRDIFVSIAEASAALGLSSEQTRGSLNAIQQMMSKGNVQAEELRGQLGERLPGAFNLAAEAMGKSTEELNGMLERGEVLASGLLPKLSRLLSERYGAAERTAAKETDNATAAVNRLQQAWMDSKVAVAESGALDALATVMNDLGFALRWATGNRTIEDVARQIEHLQKAITGDPTGVNRSILSGYLRDLRIEMAKLQAAGIDAGAIGIAPDRYSVPGVTRRTPSASSETPPTSTEAASRYATYELTQFGMIADQRIAFYEGAASAQDRAYREMERQARELERAEREALEGVGSVATDVYAAMERASTRAADTASAVFADMAASGRLSLGGLMDDLTRLASHKTFSFLFEKAFDFAFGPLGVLAGAGGLSGPAPTGAPGRASGGPVSAGSTYLVGERGPELLHMGRSSGYVTPNHRLGGGVTVNVHNHAGAQVRTEERSGADGSQIVELVIGEVDARIRGGGSTSQAISDTFPINPRVY